ncbi:MAG: pilus assembly protein PilP [Pseudomonadota bacterium]|nr:pilus assembly protein PilP [Pseudomonadota bacterium]
MQRNLRLATLVFVMSACAVLAGCGPAHQDLHQWMTEQRRQAVPRVTPIAEPKPYVPLAYSQGLSQDPFSNQRLTQALGRDSGPVSAGAALLAPELNRRKQPLESFPLDTMAMVGSLSRGAQRVALVRVNGLLHQVREGNYLGQNYGRVMRVTEGEVVLREIVQDAAGDWIERQAALELQENTK